MDSKETIIIDEITNPTLNSGDVYHQLPHNHQIKPDMAIPIIVIVSARRKHAYQSPGDHNYFRHFRKIYASQRWITVQCAPSEERVLNGEGDQIASSLLSCLERRGLSQNPLVFHLLGQHAIPVYNAITKATSIERDDLFRVKGCVVDSGPVRPSGVLPFLRKTFPTIYNVLMMLLWLLAAIFPEILPAPLEFDEFDKFCYNTGNWPQLYLYSTTDHVTCVDDVERVIGIRHRAGVPIDSKCWNDTEHARHLFTHEEEYTRLCQDFVARATALGERNAYRHRI